MSLDVCEQLRKTTKGKLVYHNDKKPLEFSNQLPSHVFDLPDIPGVLEVLEENAFVDEDECLLINKLTALTIDDSSTQLKQPDVDILPEDSTIALLDLREKQLSQNLIQLQVGKYHDATMEAHKEAKRKFKEREERIRRSRMEERKKWSLITESEREEAEKIRHEFKEQHHKRNNLLKTRMLEAERRKVEQNKQRLKHVEGVVTKCAKLNEDVMRQFHNDSSIVSSNPAIVSMATECGRKFSAIVNIFKDSKTLGSLDKVTAASITDDCGVHQEICDNLISAIEKLREEEIIRKKELEERIEKEQEEMREKEKKEKERIKASLDEDPENKFPSLPKELQLSVSRSAYAHHQMMIKSYKDFDVKSKEFTSSKDKQLNKVLIGISNVIGSCVASITSRSGSDVKNKLSDLNGLLQGRTVSSGGSTASIKGYPGASNHAIIFMARKFVKQAESQVSSNHSTAFGLALTILGVWAQNADFGSVFLGLMQTKCPFLVPFYVPKMDGQSDEEYSRSRGYRVTNGVVESQDHYLSRMSGLVRTYAAIIQSPLPPGVRNNPHGIAQGWMWITRMLNLEPWPEITATIIFDFLEVAGHALMAAYGRQFEKLLYAICHDYFPKIEEVSGSRGGPVLRLKAFLKECIQHKKVSKPDGHLSTEFWGTHHHAGIVGN